VISRRIVKALDHVDPETRRLYAARILVGTIVGWLISAAILVALGQSTFFTQLLNAISWLAITLTAADVLCTTDVRAEGTTG